MNEIKEITSVTEFVMMKELKTSLLQQKLRVKEEADKLYEHVGFLQGQIDAINEKISDFVHNLEEERI